MREGKEGRHLFQSFRFDQIFWLFHSDSIYHRGQISVFPGQVGA